MKKLLLLLLVFISLTGILHSTNYYVSNTGSNSNSGLTLNLAWATHLLAASQAIDAGSATVSASVMNDLDLNSRPLGSGYDIGCYEFSGGWNFNSEITDFWNFVSVYPNPTSLLVTVIASGANQCLSIYNSLGEKAGNWQLAIGKNEISVANLPNGIYFTK